MRSTALGLTTPDLAKLNIEVGHSLLALRVATSSGKFDSTLSKNQQRLMDIWLEHLIDLLADNAETISKLDGVNTLMTASRQP